mgnify:CR=1 FL=1
MNINYYKTSSGREPVSEYFRRLPEPDQEAVAVDIRIISDYGIRHPSLVTRKLKNKLWEIKTGTRHQQRIFYCLVTDNGIVLLHACKKQKQGAQRNDVDFAYKRMKEVLS